MTDTGRRSGRTLAMVKALPETGCVVVVPTAAMRDYVRRMVFDVRGGNVLKRTTIKILTRPEDVHTLYGRDEPIHVDHAWYDFALCRDHVQPGTMEALHYLIDRQKTRKKHA